MTQQVDVTTVRREAVWLHLTMCLFIVAIVTGLLIPEAFAMTKILVPSVLLGSAALSQIVVYFFYAVAESDQKARNKVYCITLLIWLLFPASAALNAYGVAIGGYNPISDDNYPYSMGYWWLGVTSQLAIGVVITYEYLRRSVSERKHSRAYGYVLASWILQTLAFVAWGWGPELFWTWIAWCRDEIGIVASSCSI